MRLPTEERVAWGLQLVRVPRSYWLHLPPEPQVPQVQVVPLVQVVLPAQGRPLVQGSLLVPDPRWFLLLLGRKFVQWQERIAPFRGFAAWLPLYHCCYRK